MFIKLLLLALVVPVAATELPVALGMPGAIKHGAWVLLTAQE